MRFFFIFIILSNMELSELRQRIRDVHESMMHAGNYEHAQELGHQLANLRRQYLHRRRRERSARMSSNQEQLKKRMADIEDKLVGAGNQEYFEALEQELMHLQRLYRRNQTPKRNKKRISHSVRYPYRYPRKSDV